MSSVLYDIPLDTWFEVAELLDTQDLINLRIVNKHFHYIFSLNTIWKPLATSRWFKIDDQPREIIKDTKEYFAYYTERNQIDVDISKSMEKIVHSTNSNEIFEIGWSLVNLRYKAIPKLVQLKSFGANLSIKYYSHMILCSIRHGEVIKLLQELGSKYLTPIDGDAEDLLFKLSYIDPAFDRLLPFRQKIIENTIEAVQLHPKLDESTPSSLRILIIRNCLIQCLNFQKDTHPFTPYQQQYVEDSFILRVYAGEALGSKIVFESIVQKIAKYFDVESILTESFMIVKDDTFHDGKAYILMTPKKAKVFSHRHIIRTLGLRQSDLEKLLIPLTNKHILNEVIGTEIHFGLFESEIAKNNSYDEIYNISHSSIRKSHIQFFNHLLHAILSNPKFSGDLLSSTITHREIAEQLFIENLTRELPFNCVHFQNGLLNEQFSSQQLKTSIIKNFYKFSHLNIYSEDSYEKIRTPLKFKIGQIVHHTRTGQIGVIIGHKNEYFTIFNQYGETRVCDKDTLLQMQDITKLDLHILTTELWIGVLFTHFDFEQDRFIPTQHLLNLFPNLRIMN
ncbi:Mitochondrial distribution and morphology protein 30 [Wickerhamomyces ciferrii]|uniref:Mitochondrial distribution and morphology protein 30 n=1 Tax=Wickerhamomyces ciferrii (strain ATCC 14091 / BCRC 22168 / CBS 111 / JCM 3599 / NBRC 0793 / NRRL Y-1031 F-60-10) TaxID=1206466 RepID=K0KT39_WICCF|nr:Mitochondrial distribution and morphology protein 30 [Wickerhamomyces ciferrii]CCH44539.1 Mitochondrial distribution and morphology protein 30 [Wickerhamomyces ciferrii]